MIYLVAKHQLSVRRSCCCVGLSRAAFYSTPQGRDRDAEIIGAINAMIDKEQDLDKAIELAEAI